MLKPKKLLVNQLCERAEIAPAYTGIDDQSKSSQVIAIRRNAFYGQALSTG